MGLGDFLGKAIGGVGGFLLGGPAGAAAGYGLASSLGGAMDRGGGGGMDPAYAAVLKRYEDPTADHQQLADYIKSQVAGAMPQFNAGINRVRGDAIRRGISTGDLGTSNEGDFANAFGGKLTQSIADETYNNYNHNKDTYLDLLTGGMDRQKDQENSDANRNAGLFGSILNAAGTYFGGKK